MPFLQELVRVLRRTSEDVNAMDLVTENYGPIHALISSHHNKKVDLLMAFVVHSSANIDLTTTVKGSTALHLAIEVRVLIIIISDFTLFVWVFVDLMTIKLNVVILP